MRPAAAVAWSGVAFEPASTVIRLAQRKARIISPSRRHSAASSAPGREGSVVEGCFSFAVTRAWKARLAPDTPPYSVALLYHILRLVPSDVDLTNRARPPPGMRVSAARALEARAALALPRKAPGSGRTLGSGT